MRLPLCLLLLAAPTFAEEGDLKATKEPTAFEYRTKKVKHVIDLKEVRRGLRGSGDPRDKLPPIYKPVITTAKDAARFMKASDRVLGIVIEKEARAYPIFILQVHEMCNDTLAGRPIAPNY